MATETTYRIDDAYDLSVVASSDTMYVLEDGYLLPTLAIANGPPAAGR